MSRRLAREVAFKAMFQRDVGHNSIEPALSQLIEEEGLGGENARFARELAEGAAARQKELDEIISAHLANWTLKRLAGVDRNILRLAAYEIINYTDTPVAVIINEALEMGRLYHDEESAKFINGVLDKIAHEKRPEGEVK